VILTCPLPNDPAAIAADEHGASPLFSDAATALDTAVTRKATVNNSFLPKIIIKNLFV
jgi:hypothetical protein